MESADKPADKVRDRAHDGVTRPEAPASLVNALREVIRIERSLRRQAERALTQMRTRLESFEGRGSAVAVRAPVAYPGGRRREDRPPAAAVALADEATVLAPRPMPGKPDKPPHANAGTEQGRSIVPTPARRERSRAQGNSATAQPLPPGFMLYEYRIDGVLGHGGFGVTYLATDINLNASVAVKEYLPMDMAHRAIDQSVFPLWPEDRELYQAGLEAFLVEARTLASFRHANIVRVARFFEIHNTAYAVLDYENGTSLKNWWPRHADTTEAELIDLLHPLLEGLAVVHESGFLHRDIKPDNIYVRRDQGSMVLLDFGSARETLAGPDLLSNAVTPGYAPPEQYSGVEQGAWTDIYALGATLYWMVAGAKPPPAPARADRSAPMTPAIEAGYGRFSSDFLRAIDWALELQPSARPQDVHAFTRALCGAHAAALPLAEALEASEAALPAVENLRMLLRSPHKLGQALRALPARLVRPRSWPLAAKMMSAMLLTSLLPMVILAWSNWRGGVDALTRLEERNLERIAQSSAGRISQVLEDSRSLADYLAGDPDLAALLTAPGPGAQRAIQAKLDSLVKSIPDIYPILLLDAAGRAVASSDRGVTGRNFAFRDYFRSAMAGQPFMTGIVVGATAGASGVYYAYPVRDAGRHVVGVLALRIKGEKFAAILDEVTRDSGRKPMLVDGNGVLIHTQDARYLYRSLAPLPQEARDAIAADRRFRNAPVESLGMDELARPVLGARNPGNVRFNSTLSGVEEVAGFAPVAAHDWVVVISETHEVFEAPMRRLYWRILAGASVAGFLFLGMAVLFARSIVGPIEQLTQAAHALKRGDYDRAGISVRSDDEIGRLARTFNVMIDVLRQRDRERQRANRPLRRAGDGL